MFNIKQKHHRVVGLTIAIASFLMLFVGIRGIGGNEINSYNILAFIVFSIVVGTISSLTVFFNLRIIFLSFVGGLAIGSFSMYRAFWDGMTGWGDLIGLLSLFIWTLIGLGVGILGQFGYYLYNKYKNNTTL